LTKVGAKPQLTFIPKQNHISEMLTVSRDDDLTVQSALTSRIRA
jgi:hypothetical protein